MSESFLKAERFFENARVFCVLGVRDADSACWRLYIDHSRIRHFLILLSMINPFVGLIPPSLYHSPPLLLSIGIQKNSENFFLPFLSQKIFFLLRFITHSSFVLHWRRKNIFLERLEKIFRIFFDPPLTARRPVVQLR